ncbi:MAG: cytochrome c peroxidase [Pseudomonadota bacterium]
MRKILWILIGVLFLPVCGITAPLEPFRDIPVPAENPQTTAKVELGKKLFFDRRLSGDGTMNCVTCHDPELGYSDGLEISLNYPTTRNWRNSPTLFNVAFQKHLFHDGRASTLEEQALFPMMSAFEMNQNLDFMEEEIRSVPEYVEEFTAVFGDGDVTRERIAMAIAAFERTLISRDAPLDRFLAGDKNALSPQALKGYEIFTGKGKCSECHFGFHLADDKFHVLHVQENPEHLKDPRIAATRRFVAKVYHFDEYRTLAEDPGRYLITKDRKDWKAFKTPALREIVRTAPYMHNGVYATLSEVIEFFDSGGGKGNTALKPLQLTSTEKEQLRIFLEEGLTGKPLTFTYPKVP